MEARAQWSLGLTVAAHPQQAFSELAKALEVRCRGERARAVRGVHHALQLSQLHAGGAKHVAAKRAVGLKQARR